MPVRLRRTALATAVDRVVLTDHPLVQLVLEGREAVALRRR